MAAMSTANTVIASAKRFSELRQPWLTKSSRAEIRVPAWPMPIHHT